MVAGAPGAVRDLQLVGLLEDDGALFTHYRRRPGRLMPSTQLLPPVAPMLAKAAKEVPASTGDDRLPLRTQVGRVPLPALRR